MGTYRVAADRRDEMNLVLNSEVNEQSDVYWSQPDLPWRTIETFSDLRDAMVRYLRGEERMSPWSVGPLADESAIILDDLITINELGAITFGSQPGLDNGQVRQRAYLQLLVDDSIVPTLRLLADSAGLVFAANPHQALEPELGRFVVTEDSTATAKTYAPIGIAYPVDTVYPQIEAIDILVRSRTTVDLADTDWNTNRLFGLVISVLSRVSS